MAFCNPAELTSHLYEEIQTEISRADITKMEKAIAAAVEEVGGFLSNYDREAIFSASNDSRNPIILLFVKDVAVWHFIQLSNPNVDMALREQRYDKAIARLKDIQKGVLVPNLPLPSTPNPPAQNGQVRFGDRRKRNTGYL